MNVKEKIFKAGSLLILGFMFTATVPFVWGATRKIWTMTGDGSRRNTVEFEILARDTNTAADFLPGADNTNDLGSSSYAFRAIYTYDLAISDDLTVADDLTVGGNDLVRGSLSTAISTLTTSGTSYGEIFTAYLIDGGLSAAVVEGQVLCSTNAATSNNSVAVIRCGATAELETVIGVAVAAASTGSVVNVYNSGWVLALTTGTVTPGVSLVSSNDSAGYFEATTSTTTNRVRAMALGAGAFAGGLTRVKLR